MGALVQDQEQMPLELGQRLLLRFQMLSVGRKGQAPSSLTCGMWGLRTRRENSIRMPTVLVLLLCLCSVLSMQEEAEPVRQACRPAQLTSFPGRSQILLQQ